LIPTPRLFAAQLRRLALTLACAAGLLWLGVPHAHAASALRSTPLLAAASRFLGGGNFTHFRGPWCAAAVGRWLSIAGYRRLRSLRAIDYARYGRRSGPRPGALAVMRHHVGIVVGVSRRGVLLLSGNHRHRVSLGVYPRRRIVAYRSPV
jgi:uncharacterized protein (TIGR02594 family)